MEKKLFLLDAYALIYRAYFAFSNNHRINSKGLNTSAIFGFTNTLLDVIRKERPTHIAVVFDTSTPTVRHEQYPAYKATREEMPEDLRKSIPYIIKLIEGFNIPVLFADGYEADDVIATLAVKAEKEGYTTYMMTPDKDFGQVVTDRILIYKPARLGNAAEILGVAEVCKRFEISEPKQVIDILGLMGDKVDNIPGIPGVGEKTAIQLIKDFGSIENMLAETSKLKGKLKEKVENNREMAILSKQLATILLDAPVEFEDEKFRICEPNKELLRDLFNDLEFRALAQKILGEPLQEADASVSSTGNEAGQMDLFGSSAAVQIEKEIIDAPITFATIATTAHTYHIADSDEKINELIGHLLNAPEFAFDTETTSLDAHQAELVSASFSWKEHDAWFVPFPEERMQAQALADRFRQVFENEKSLKIGQNLKYDITVLKNYGIRVKGNYFDTMVAHFLINPEMRHNMDVLSETYLKYSPISIEELIGKKGKGQLSMREVPLQLLADYSAEDADVTYRLKNLFVPMLEKTGMQKLFDEIEIPLIDVLADMEREGINLSTESLSQLSAELGNLITDVESLIQKDAGTSFNVSSPKQVGDILFEILRIDEKPKKTKTGQYATSEDVLAKLVNKHPIVNRILDYRELQKLKNTYVDTLPELINPNTKRIHTSYNQVVVVTGRLSSDNPNLQNIPIRTEKGREVRKAFIPRDSEHVLLSADYSQIELRIIAELSKDPGMIEAFVKGQDIHAATASKVYNVPLEEVTSDMRRNAKMVNFGIVYGISAFGLSERLNIPRKEAASIIDSYFTKYPGVKEYMDKSIDSARKLGYVETIMGRKRHLRDINSGNATVRGFAERNAINAPIQGSAADMIKIAMINIHRELNNGSYKSRMLLQVHDELVFDVYHSEVDKLRAMVEDKMKNAITMSVPIEVGIGTGHTWLEAH